MRVRTRFSQKRFQIQTGYLATNAEEKRSASPTTQHYQPYISLCCRALSSHRPACESTQLSDSLLDPQPTACSQCSLKPPSHHLEGCRAPVCSPKPPSRGVARQSARPSPPRGVSHASLLAQAPLEGCRAPQSVRPSPPRGVSRASLLAQAPSRGVTRCRPSITSPASLPPPAATAP